MDGKLHFDYRIILVILLSLLSFALYNRLIT